MKLLLGLLLFVSMNGLVLAQTHIRVLCEDGTEEVRPAETLAHACEPEWGVKHVKANDRSLSLRHRLKKVLLWNMGQEIWEGHVSFVAYVQGEPSRDYLTFEDGRGGHWTVRGTKVKFVQLALPVKVLGTSDVSKLSYGRMSEIVYDVEKVNPLKDRRFAGKTDVFSSLGTIGHSIPGVTLSFRVSSKFFQNFDAGTRCGAIAIEGRNKKVVVDATQGTQEVSAIVAPVVLKITPRCQSSRLKSPENSEIDFQLTVQDIVLGDPV